MLVAPNQTTRCVQSPPSPSTNPPDQLSPSLIFIRIFPIYPLVYVYVAYPYTKYSRYLSFLQIFSQLSPSLLTHTDACSNIQTHTRRLKSCSVHDRTETLEKLQGHAPRISHDPNLPWSCNKKKSLAYGPEKHTHTHTKDHRVITTLSAFDKWTINGGKLAGCCQGKLPIWWPSSQSSSCHMYDDFWGLILRLFNPGGHRQLVECTKCYQGR